MEKDLNEDRPMSATKRWVSQLLKTLQVSKLVKINVKSTKLKYLMTGTIVFIQVLVRCVNYDMMASATTVTKTDSFSLLSVLSLFQKIKSVSPKFNDDMVRKTR